MSESGYWKNKGAQQKFKADKHTKQIEFIMSDSGWIKIRDSTPKEDREEKWDALWLDKFSKEQRVDYKTGSGVQDSHKKLWDKGELKVTRYAMFNPKQRYKLRMVDARDFWGNNPSRHLNGHRQVYWIEGP